MEGPRNCAEGQQRDAESTSDGSGAGLCVASKTHLLQQHTRPRTSCEHQWDLIILGLAQSFHLDGTLEGHAEAIGHPPCGP